MYYFNLVLLVTIIFAGFFGERLSSHMAAMCNNNKEVSINILHPTNIGKHRTNVITFQIIILNIILHAPQ